MITETAAEGAAELAVLEGSVVRADDPGVPEACRGLVWPREVRPASVNAYEVYLASRHSKETERAMRRLLDQIACWAQGVEYKAPSLGNSGNRGTGAWFPWEQLRFSHTSAIHAQLLRSNLSPSTINSALTALRKVLETAWKLGQISTDDYLTARSVEGPTAPRVLAGRGLSKDEIAALVEVCRRDVGRAETEMRGRRDAALVILMASAGLREAEVASAEIRNYDGAGRWLKVIGKGNKQREVPVHPKAAQALDAWLGAASLASGPLFRNIDRHRHVTERPLTTEGIRYILKRRGTQAGLRPFTPHDFRRTFIGDTLDAGAHLPQVQQIVGHANANTTSRYVRHSTRALQAAVDRLDVPGLDDTDAVAKWARDVLEERAARQAAPAEEPAPDLFSEVRDLANHPVVRITDDEIEARLRRAEQRDQEDLGAQQ
jgi:site-specific recombinase XerD